MKDKRFWSKVNITDSCWLWTASVNGKGYGQMSVGGRRGRPHLAHRLSWQMHRGPIPEGMSVLHRCDNPPCVNPEHLFLGTRADNNNDMRAKGRAAPMPNVEGEKHPMAILTASDVEGVRRMLASGNSGRSIAALFGVSESTISDIKRGRSWTRGAL